MRNLKRYPITLGEIERCLLELARGLETEARIGDMRPVLLRAAAKALLRIDFVTYDLGEITRDAQVGRKE